jgi:hypothetical protein
MLHRDPHGAPAFGAMALVETHFQQNQRLTAQHRVQHKSPMLH